MTEQLEVKIRTTEAQTREVFVDVNDLIIELMMDEQNASSQEVKAAIRAIIKKLTGLRKQGHERLNQ